jgi:two-component sensor histidine kinase
LDHKPHLAGTAAPARLKRGAGVLIAVFWSVHFFIMLFRAELYDPTGERELLEGATRRVAFALFGALLSYGVYRCLRPLRLRGFGRQAMVGAAIALVAACIQGGLNAIMFGGRSPHVADFIYVALYWFWFYFSWTAAYLALSYSITVQEQERHAAELTVKAQEAQVRALRYQINPHFLFNTLNAIAALVRDAPPKAEEMVLQLSDFFRRTLAVNPTEDVTLSEEVDLQRLYLEIERTRFPDRLGFDVALAPGTAEALVPALLLQPLVENAVKHGVARSEGPTTIRIRARSDGPVLEIVVENDARPAKPAAGGQAGVIAEQRPQPLAHIAKSDFLPAGEIGEGGFRNVVRIPLRR